MISRAELNEMFELARRIRADLSGGQRARNQDRLAELFTRTIDSYPTVWTRIDEWCSSGDQRTMWQVVDDTLRELRVR